MDDPINGKNSSSAHDNLDLENILAEFSDSPVKEESQGANTSESNTTSTATSGQTNVSDSVKVSSAKPDKIKNPESLSSKKEKTAEPDGDSHKKTASDMVLKRETSKSIGKVAKSESEKRPDREKVAENRKPAKRRKEKTGKADKLPVIIGVVLGIIALLIMILLCIFPADSNPVGSEVTPSVTVAVTPDENSVNEPEADTIDSAFLSELEGRLTALVTSDEANLREAVKANIETDLELFSPYCEAEFTDETLGTIAVNYIDALNKEASSFDAVYEEADLLWYEGYVQQMQMLTRLYKSYGFMSSNTAFLDKFITPLSEVSVFYNKYSIISKDIRTQINGITYLDYVNDYRYKTTLKNRTNYTFDITFYFDNYNELLPDDEEEAAGIEPSSSAEDALTNITPLKSYVVTDRVTSGVAKMKTFVCHWSITSID